MVVVVVVIVVVVVVVVVMIGAAIAIGARFEGVVVLAGDDHVEVGRGDTAFVDPRTNDVPTVDGDRAQRALDRVEIGAGVDQGPENHVPAGAAHHFKVRDAHAITPGRGAATGRDRP